MKRLMTVFTFLSFLLLLVACSDTDASQNEKLELYMSGDTVESSALTKMAEKYTEETGVEIEIVDIPYDDLFTKISNKIRSNDVPALARVTGFEPILKDHLLDLKDIAERHNVNTDYGVTFDGKLVAPPLDLTAVGMFINADLFEEAGVAYPTSDDDIWTWDEFIDSLEKVLEKTDAKYGMVMDDTENRLRAFLYQHGSDDFYEENGAYTTNSETKEAIQKFVDLNDDRIMPKSVWTAGEDAASMFKSGLVAAYMSGSWQIVDFTETITDFEWKSVYMPYEDVRSTNLGGNYLIAFDGSGQEEEAKEFIDWLYEKENYEELAKLGGYLPVIADAEIEYEYETEAHEIYENEIAASDPIASYERTELTKKQLISQSNANGTLFKEVKRILNNEIDIDEAIENTKKAYTDAYVE